MTLEANTTPVPNDQAEAQKLKAGQGNEAAQALAKSLGSVQDQINQNDSIRRQTTAAAGKYVLPMSIEGAAANPATAAPADVVARNAASEAPVTDAAATRTKAEKLPDGSSRQVVDGSTVTSDKWGRVTQIEDANHQTSSFKYADKQSKSQPDTLLQYTDTKGNTLSRPDGTSSHWTTADGQHFDGSIAASKDGVTFSDAQTNAKTTINTDGSRKTVYGDNLEVDQDASGKPTKVVDTNGKVIDAKNLATDGNNVSFSRDNGAVVKIAPDGSRNTQNADGSTVQTNDAQKVTSVTTASGSNYQFEYDKSGNMSAFKNEQGWWQSGDGGKNWTNSTEDPTTKKVTDTSIAANVSVDGQGNFTVASAKQPGDVQAASKTIHTDGSQTQANTDGSSLTVNGDGSRIAKAANGDMSVTNANNQQYQFQFQHDASGNVVTDANGNKKLSSVTNANGHYELQPDGKTWNNTDPNAKPENKTWSGTMSVNAQGDYSYTPSDTNIKTTLKADGTTIQQNPDTSQVATDKNGQIARSIDASGHVTTFGHDATTGALNKITTDAGSWSTADGTNWSNGSTVWSGAISVNNNTGDISYKDGSKTTTARLDGTSNISNSDGSNLSLNQQGKISTVQDGAHHTFNFGYQSDASGKQSLTSAQTPDGTYSSKDGGKTFTGPDGKAAEVKLDSSGNLTVSDSSKSTLYQTDGSKVTSDSSNRVTNVVDAAGRQSSYQYGANSGQITGATINDTVSGKTTNFTSTDGGATLTDGKHTVNSMQVDKQGNLSYVDEKGALKNNYSDGTSFNIKADGGSYNTDAKGQLTDATTANGVNVSLKRSSDGSITDAYTSLGHFKQTQKDTWTNEDKPSEVVHGSLTASNDGTLAFARTDGNVTSMKGDQTTVERPDHSSFTKNSAGDTVAASTQSATAEPKSFTYQYSQNATTGKSELSGYSTGGTQWTKSGSDTWTSSTGESFHGTVALDKNELPQITKTDTKTTTTYGVSGGVREVDSSGKLVAKEAPNGNKESYGYDSSGALSSIKSDAGTWTRTGSATSGTWSNGSDTFKGNVTLDNRGNQSWVASDNSVRKSVAADGAEKDYFSDKSGQINAVVGKNSAGQVTDTLDGQGRSTQYSYQGGKLAAVSDGQNTWKANADGKSWSLNGDNNQQFHGTVAVDSHGTQTWANADNGSVRRASADGSQATTLANGARIENDATGEKTTYTQASTTGKPTQIQVTPDETRITNPTTRTTLSQKTGSDSFTLSDAKGNVLSEAHGSITVDHNGNAQVVNRDTNSVVSYTNDGRATVSKLAADGVTTQGEGQPRGAGTTTGEGQPRGAGTTTGEGQPRGAGTTTADGLPHGSGTTTAQENLRAAGTQDALRGTGTQDTLRGTGTQDAVRGTGTQDALRGTGTGGITANPELGPLGTQASGGSLLRPTSDIVDRGVAARAPIETAGVTGGRPAQEAGGIVNGGRPAQEAGGIVNGGRPAQEGGTINGVKTGQEAAGSTLATLNAASGTRIGNGAPLHQDAPIVAHQPTVSSTVASGEALFKASAPENTLSVSNIGGQNLLSANQGGGRPATLGGNGPGEVKNESYSSSLPVTNHAPVVNNVSSGEYGSHLRAAPSLARFEEARAREESGYTNVNRNEGNLENQRPSGQNRYADANGGGNGYGNHGDGLVNRVDGSNNRVDGSNNRVDGSNNRVDGSNNRVDGSNNRVDGSNNRVDGSNNRVDLAAGRVDGGTNRMDGGANRVDGSANRIDQPNGAPRQDGVQLARQDNGLQVPGVRDGQGSALRTDGQSVLVRADGGVTRTDGRVGDVSPSLGAGKVETVGGQLVAKLDGTGNLIAGKSGNSVAGQSELSLGKSAITGSSETLLKGSVSVDGKVTALADGKLTTHVDGKAISPTGVEGSSRIAAGTSVADGKLGSATTGAGLAATGKDGLAAGAGTLAATGKLAGSDLANNKLPNGLERYAVGPGTTTGAPEKVVALNNPNPLPAGQLAKLGFADGSVLLNGGKPGDLQATSLAALAGGKGMEGKATDVRATGLEGKATVAANQLDSKAGGLDSKIVSLQAQQVASLDAAKGRVDVSALGNHQAPQVLAKNEVGAAPVVKAPTETAARGPVQDVRIGDIGRGPIRDQVGQPIQETKTVTGTTTTAAGGTVAAGGATGGAAGVPAGGAAGVPGHSVAGLASTTANLNAPGQSATSLGGHNQNLNNAAGIVGQSGPQGVTPLQNVTGSGHSTNLPNGVSNLPNGVSVGATGALGATAASPTGHDPNGPARSTSGQGQPISISGGINIGPNGAPSLNVNVGVNLGNGQPGANLGVAVNLGGNNGQLHSEPTRGSASPTPTGVSNMPGGVSNMPGGMSNMPGGVSNMPGGVSNMPGGVSNMPGGVSNMPGGVSNMPGGNHGAPSGLQGSPSGLPGASVNQSGKSGSGSQAGNGASGLPGNGTININLGSGGTNNGIVNIPGSSGNTNAGVINVNGGSSNVNNGVINIHGGNGKTNAGTINYNNGSGNVNNGTINSLGGNGSVNVGTVNTNNGVGNINNGATNSVGNTNNGPTNSVGSQGGHPGANGGTKAGGGSLNNGGGLNSAPGGVTNPVLGGVTNPVSGGTAGQAANGSGQTSSNPTGTGSKLGVPIATGTGQQSTGTTGGANPIGATPVGGGSTSPLPVQTTSGQPVSGSSQNPPATGSGSGGSKSDQPPSQINNAPGGSTVQSNPGQNYGGSHSGQGPVVSVGHNPGNGNSGVSVTIPISGGIGLTLGESTGPNGQTHGNIGVTIGGVSIGIDPSNGQVNLGGSIGGIIGGLLGLGGGSGYGDPSHGSGGGILHPGPPGGYPGTGSGTAGTGTGGYPTGGGLGTGTGGHTGTGTGSGFGTGTGNGFGTGTGTGLGSGNGNGNGSSTGTGSTDTGSGSGSGFGTGTNSGGDGTATNPSNPGNSGVSTGPTSGGSDSSTYTGTGDGGNGSNPVVTNPGSGSDPGIPSSIGDGYNGLGSFANSGDPSSAGIASGTSGGSASGSGSSAPSAGGTDSGNAPLSGTILYNDGGSASGSSSGAGNGNGSGSGSSPSSQSTDGGGSSSGDAGSAYNTPGRTTDGSSTSSGTGSTPDQMDGSGSSGTSGGAISNSPQGAVAGDSNFSPTQAGSLDDSNFTPNQSGASQSANTGDSGSAQSQAGTFSESNSAQPQSGTTGDSNSSQSQAGGSADPNTTQPQSGSEGGSISSASAQGQANGDASFAPSAGDANFAPTQAAGNVSDFVPSQSGALDSDIVSNQFGSSSDFAPNQYGSSADFAANQSGTSGSETSSNQSGSANFDSAESRSGSSRSESSSNPMGADFASIDNGSGYSAADGFIPSFNDNGSGQANINNAVSDSGSGDSTGSAFTNSVANADERSGANAPVADQTGGGSDWIQSNLDPLTGLSNLSDFSAGQNSGNFDGASASFTPSDFDQSFNNGVAQDQSTGDLTSFAPHSGRHDSDFGGVSSASDFGPGDLSSFDQQPYDGSTIADRTGGGEGTRRGSDQGFGDRSDDLTSFTGQTSNDDGFMPGSLASDQSSEFSSTHRHHDHASANSQYDGDSSNSGTAWDGGSRAEHNGDFNPDAANFDGGWGNTAAGLSGELGDLVSFDNRHHSQDQIPIDGSASGGSPYGNDDLTGQAPAYDDGNSYGGVDGHQHKHHGDAWSGDLSETGMTSPDGREFGEFGEPDGPHKHRSDLGIGWLDSDNDNAANRIDRSDLVAQTASSDDNAIDAAMRQMRIEDDEARLRQDRLDLQERLDREHKLKQDQDALQAEQDLKALLQQKQDEKSREDEATRLLALIASAQEEEKREDNKQELYRVQPGDTLERIALSKFRDPSVAPLIFELNKSKIEMQVSGTKVAYRLKEGSLLTLPSRRQIREFKQRQLTAAARGLDVFGQPLTGNAKRHLDESQQRRANVEKILGQIDHAPTDGRVRANVRLGDTLRSISMKHPGINDVSLWKLLAEVNGLSTDVDIKGTPVAQLRRGTSLIIPSADDIETYRKKGTLSSSAQRPVSTSLPPRSDMTVITGNRNPLSLNIKAENLDPVEQKWVQETLINSLIEKLGESCRVVKSSDGGESRMMRSQLEVLTGDVWIPIITYEICETASVRYEIAPDGSRVSIPIDLPSSTVEELMSNDLQRNWRSYAKQFLKNRTEAS